MLFLFRILDRTPFPAVRLFFGEPAFVGLRRRLRLTSVLRFEVKPNTFDGALFLPIRSIIPFGLGIIAEELAVTAVDFVGDHGDQAHNAIIPHMVSFSDKKSSAAAITPSSGTVAPVGPRTIFARGFSAYRRGS